MLSSERSFVDSVTHPLANALEFAFGCHHRKLSRVFTIDGRTYKVCCKCGATFDYSLRTMSVVEHHNVLTALRRLRARRRQQRRSLLRRWRSFKGSRPAA